MIAYIITHNKGYPRRLGENRGERRSQYECGIELMEEEAGESIKKEEYIKYYIIGIIFLIFDLESKLLYPIIFSPALNYLQTTSIFKINNFMFLQESINMGYIIFLIFMFMLIIGLIYEYKKKVLI